MAGRCGGTGEMKTATEKVQKICDQVKEAVEEKLGRTLEEFVAKIYKSQVVAGTNYFVKVHVGSGKFVHLRIYHDLKNNVTLHGLQEDKNEEEEVVYF